MKQTHKSSEVEANIPEEIYFVDGYCHDDGKQHKGYKTFVNMVSIMIHHDKGKEKKQTKIIGPRAVIYTSSDGRIYQIILEEDKWILVSFMFAGKEYCHLMSDKDIDNICTVIENKSLSTNDSSSVFIDEYLTYLHNTLTSEHILNCKKAMDDSIIALIKFNKRCH